MERIEISSAGGEEKMNKSQPTRFKEQEVKSIASKNAAVSCIHYATTRYFNWLEKDISAQFSSKKEIPDLIHLFIRSKNEYETEMKKLNPVFKSNPKIAVWVSWYKKSSGMATDLTEDIIRNYALQHDLVDIKVCAVSNVWSGLKLVVPKNKR